MYDSITIEEIAELKHELGPTLIAFTTGNRDRKIVDKWLEASACPSPDEVARLACALEQFRRVSKAENSDIARSWFLGASVPGHDEEVSPGEAIRNDNFDGVKNSATRLINDEWS